MALAPATSKQIPNEAILDVYNKQAYLGNQFVYPLKVAAVASTAETPLLLIQGIGTSANTYSNKSPTALFITLKTMICDTASQNVLFSFYTNPAFSDTGPIKTPLNARTGSATTSVATVSTSPTIVSNGTLMEQSAVSGVGTYESTAMIILDAGQSLLLTATCSANPTNVGAVISWYEL